MVIVVSLSLDAARVKIFEAFAVANSLYIKISKLSLRLARIILRDLGSVGLSTEVPSVPNRTSLSNNAIELFNFGF